MIIIYIMPIAFTIMICVKQHNRLVWLFNSLLLLAFTIWIFQAGAWDLVYWYRYIMLLIAIFAVVMTGIKNQALPWIQGRYKFDIFISGALALFFIVNSFNIMDNYSYEGKVMHIASPLQDGVFMVVQGGGGTGLNYHAAYPPQRYAMDIVELAYYTSRAKGIMPKALSDYVIYETPIYSPCNGVVTSVENNLPDMKIGATDKDNATGNHVAIQCEETDATLYLAHMKTGTVEVAEGDVLQVGERLGQVGNSGNTSEPHLHIHAELDGNGVPLLINDRFLKRNSLLKMQ